MLKDFKVLTTVLLLLLMSNLNAQIYRYGCCDEEPCFSEDLCCKKRCCPKVFLGVEFLWLKPCVDDLDYATLRDSDNREKFEILSITPDWEPGVRATIGISRVWCDFGFRSSYTYIKASDRACASANQNIVNPLTHPGLEALINADSAKGVWDSCYHEWETLFYYEIISGSSCHSFSPFFGAAGLVLRQELENKLTRESSGPNGQIESVYWQSNLWGAGLRVGTNYLYQVSDCLSFFATCNASILSSNSNDKIVFDNDIDDNEIDLSLKGEEKCLLIPGYHLAIAFLYHPFTCSLDYSVKVGYEFLVWHNIRNHRSFGGQSSTGAAVSVGSSPTTRTFGYHGLIVGINLGF